MEKFKPEGKETPKTWEEMLAERDELFRRLRELSEAVGKYGESSEAVTPDDPSYRNFGFSDEREEVLTRLHALNEEMISFAVEGGEAAGRQGRLDV